MCRLGLLLWKVDWHAFVAAALLSALGLSLASCLVKDDHCDPNQVELHGKIGGCVCAEDSVPDPIGYGCIQCSEHEVVKSGRCECVEGYSRTSATSPCEESAIGSACEPASSTCPTAFPYCASTLADATKGYCTTADCKASADCPSTWVCDKTGTDAFCSMPPTGQSMPCESSDDCAGFEATYCISSSKVCLVQGCAKGQAKCHGEWSCCDLTSLGYTDVCVPNATRIDANGNCPGGAKPVSP